MRRECGDRSGSQQFRVLERAASEQAIEQRRANWRGFRGRGEAQRPAKGNFERTNEWEVEHDMD